MKLTHKIVAIGAIGIIGLGIVGLIYRHGLSIQDEYRRSASEARVIAALTNRAFIGALEARRAEKDFLLRGEDASVTRHAALMQTVAEELGALQQLAAAARRAEIAQQVEALRSGLASYASHFGAVVATRRRLGVDATAGLQAALAKSVAAIEKELEPYDEPRLAAALMAIRGYEKDFLLKRDPAASDEIKNHAANFGAVLASAAVPRGTLAEIERKFAAYEADFTAAMNASVVLARTQRTMSDAYTAVEPIVETVLKAVEADRAGAEAADSTSRAETTWQMQAAILAIILAVGGIAYLIGRGIARPIGAMTTAMRELAAGTFEVVLPGLARRDEIGEMARAVESFKVKALERARRDAEEEDARARAAAAERKAEMHRIADAFEGAVGDVVEMVSSAAAQLETAATTLTKGAESTQQLSALVAEASEESSSSVRSVAAATGQITGSVHEISRQVQHSSTIAGEAVRQAHRTDARIAELSQAASRIGDVVKLITGIAEQTNLLALNATIEAARAGEAGKGFAVVASEVKTLAMQTAKATDEIGAQIAAMQAATRDSVGAIKEIGATIARIADIATGIAAAVEQQGASMQDIARNVQQAAQGAAQVATNIGEVNREAAQTGSASTEVLASARSLTLQGNRLKDELRGFLERVRAA